MNVVPNTMNCFMLVIGPWRSQKNRRWAAWLSRSPILIRPSSTVFRPVHLVSYSSSYNLCHLRDMSPMVVYARMCTHIRHRALSRHIASSSTGLGLSIPSKYLHHCTYAPMVVYNRSQSCTRRRAYDYPIASSTSCLGFHPIIAGYLCTILLRVNGEPEGASISMASEGASPLINVSEGALIECPNAKLLFQHLRRRSDTSQYYGF